MSIGPVQRYSLRSGLSLLEVVLAIAILGAALSVILNLVYMGSTSASNAQRFSQAQIMCDTIMAEIASGVIHRCCER